MSPPQYRLATIQDISDIRREFDDFKGGVHRHIAERDKAMGTLIGNVRDDLIDEIRSIKESMTDPVKWAETTAIRNMREIEMKSLERKVGRAEKSKRIAYASAGAIVVLSPAIARLLDALANWILRH